MLIDTCYLQQTREIVNLAILTGKMQTYNIRIYSVTHSGHITDVTSQSTCHSSDPSVLKVRPPVSSCPNVSTCLLIQSVKSFWLIRGYSRYADISSQCLSFVMWQTVFVIEGSWILQLGFLGWNWSQRLFEHKHHCKIWSTYNIYSFQGLGAWISSGNRVVWLRAWLDQRMENSTGISKIEAWTRNFYH